MCLLLLGRAFVARVCFGIAGIPFEDERIDGAELKARRGANGYNDQVPLGSLPILTLPNGQIVVQSGAIQRYAGKLAKLYPIDTEEALLVDEVIEICADISAGIPYHSDAEEKKRLREEYATGKLKIFMSLIAKRIPNGQLVLNNQLTIADINIYLTVNMLRSGFFDHIDKNYDSQWPEIQQHYVNMESNPLFAPYKL